jgi:hypothetical protein
MSPNTPPPDDPPVRPPSSGPPARSEPSAGELLGVAAMIAAMILGAFASMALSALKRLRPGRR